MANTKKPLITFIVEAKEGCKKKYRPPRNLIIKAVSKVMAYCQLWERFHKHYETEIIEKWWKLEEPSSQL